MSDAQSKTPKSVWTISNVITITRILLVPVFVAALLAPWPEWFGMNSAFSNDWKSIIAAGIFVVISCTDWLDGYLARSRGEVTDFGKFMDPLADKILVAAALIALVDLGDLPTWVVLVILAREFIVSGVRMMAASKGEVIAASMLGKFKTVFQMIAIVLFTIKDSHMIGDIHVALSDALWVVSWIVMLIAVGLTVASMIDYLVKARYILGFGSDDNAQDASESLDSSAIDLESLAQRLVESATRKGVTLGTAESLTGGMIGQAITAVSGSSEVYLGGITSYANSAKEHLLAVQPDDLATHGAVSSQVACQMALGACDQLGCSLAVSVTGIAGPGGAVPGKPVGTVWMGICKDGEVQARLLQLSGTREEIRQQTTAAALQALYEAL